MYLEMLSLFGVFEILSQFGLFSDLVSLVYVVILSQFGVFRDLVTVWCI